MWKTTLSSLRGHKRRLLGTSSAVLIGVAFLAGTLVLSDTIRAGFTDLFTEANAGTDAVVRSSDEFGDDDAALTQVGLLDESMVDQIGAIDGVAVAAPVVDRSGQIIGSDGDPLGGNGPPTVAGNWITDERVNPYEIVDGRAPEGPDEVVIDKKSSEDGKLDVGDSVTIRVPEPIQATVVGVATFGGADSQGGVTFAGFETSFAQQLLLPEPDQITSISVAAEDGVSQGELVQRIRPTLSEGTEAITGDALTQEQEDEIESDFLGFFTTFLTAFAVIALIVASFSIYNTFNIVVAQRTRESALLRALGASRRQILMSVGLEAFIVGVVASAIGIVAGLGLAEGLSALMDAMGFGLPRASLLLEPTTVIVSMVVGVVVTMLASLVPAVKASRVLPLAALRDVAVDRAGTARWRIVLGVFATAVGAAITVAAALGGAFPLAGLGALVTLLGVVFLGPIAAKPAGRVLGGPLARLRGMSGRLARDNAIRNPSRTANTASALMVGVAVVTMFTVLAATLKTYVDDVTRDTIDADLVVMSDNFSGVGFSPQMADDIAALPEVAVATGEGDAPLRVAGKDQLASAIDGPKMAQIMDVDFLHGSLADITKGTVAVDENQAEADHLKVGDIVPVSYADGTNEDLTLAAIYEDNEFLGDISISKETWAPHAQQADDFVVVAALADGVDPDVGEAAVQKVADRYFAPDVLTREEYIDSVAGEVNQILFFIYALLALAILIAMMGIANTLSLSIHERTRELGLLRAVGQSRRQMRVMVRGESAVVATFGALGGLLLGSFLGWALITAIGESEENFDYFTIPVGQLVVVLVVASLVGIVAGLLPARRAARINVLDAIATA
jgi:putative ABC transport system permease protein